jgi:hypothetical protein
VSERNPREHCLPSIAHSTEFHTHSPWGWFDRTRPPPKPNRFPGGCCGCCRGCHTCYRIECSRCASASPRPLLSCNRPLQGSSLAVPDGSVVYAPQSGRPCLRRHRQGGCCAGTLPQAAISFPDIDPSQSASTKPRSDACVLQFDKGRTHDDDSHHSSAFRIRREGMRVLPGTGHSSKPRLGHATSHYPAHRGWPVQCPARGMCPRLRMHPIRRVPGVR